MYREAHNKAQDDDLVMSLVELALAQPPEVRERYLQSICAQDSQLLEQVGKIVDWEQRMEGFLLDPLFTRPLEERPFQAGEILDGRFRLVRKVAEGGMGVVYEAWDEKLERRVAIKCAKPGFRKRLPPEVRNASEISHPNVCKIHEIHTASTDQGEIDFLTMEYLEGETLTERLRGGPLSKGEAQAIAQQLCIGLAEAHRNGVIHGDLKSANVILAQGADGGIRAVITDFGLARRPEAVQRAVQSGTVGGTPDYMAPELWKGEKASIASDIFALGVILYELVSGRKPYGTDVFWEERFTQKPAAIHPKWDRILVRCLDPDPSRRFQDADEIARALVPRSRRWFLATAAAVVLTAIPGVVAYQWATAPKETVRLALLPFEGDDETASLSRKVVRDTAAQLGRIKGDADTKYVFIPLTKVLSSKITTPKQAQAVLQATHVVRGTVDKQNEKLSFHVYLTDTASLVDAKKWEAEYTHEELRHAPMALAGIVTGTLRLPPLVAASSVNAAARQDYEKGLSSVRRERGVDDALHFFSSAVAADAESPLTHAGLAEAQWFKYFYAKEKIWLDLATESVRQAELRNPDLASVHRISGRLKANLGLHEQAIADYRRAIDLEPGHSGAYRRLGSAYEVNNQLDEALAAYRSAVEEEPNYYGNYQQLGSFYFQRGDYVTAASQFARAVEMAPGEPEPHRVLATAYMNLGRFAEAERHLRQALSLAETWRAVETLGHVLMYQKRDREAIPYFLRTLKFKSETYRPWMYLGIAYRRAKVTAESKESESSRASGSRSGCGTEPAQWLDASDLSLSMRRAGESWPCGVRN